MESSLRQGMGLSVPGALIPLKMQIPWEDRFLLSSAAVESGRFEALAA